MKAIPPTENRQTWAQRALALIRGCHRALAQAREEQAFLQEMCRLLVEIGGYPLAWAGFRKNHQSHRIERVAQAGLAQGLLDLLPAAGLEEESGPDPAATAILTGQPVWCADIQSEPACASYATVADALGLSSCLALPLGHQGAVFGVLTLYASGPGSFSPEKRDFLQTLAAFFGLGLTNLRVQEDLAAAAGELAEKNRLLESLPAALLVSDLEGSILQANQAALDAHGLTREKMVGSNWRNLVVPESHDLTLAQRREVVSLGEAVWESVHQRPDGTSFPAATHSRMIDLRGAKAILSLVLDISERQRLEANLRETEARYRTIFNNQQVGLFRWRLSDGRMLEANDCLARMVGYDDSKDLRQGFVARRHFVEPDTGERLLESARDGRVQNFDTRFFRRDGSVVWLRISGRLDSERNELEGVATDLTELRQARDALSSSEEQHRASVEQLLGRTLLSAAEQEQLNEKVQAEKDLYANLLSRAEEGIAGFDRDFTVILWNPPMERFTGLSQTAALGNNIFRVLPFLRELRDQSPGFESGSYRRFFDPVQPQKLSPAGPEGFYAGHLTPLLDERGEHRGGVLFIRDDTGLKRTENALKDQQSFLEGLLASVDDGVALLDRNLTIIKANRVLEQWFPQEAPLSGKTCHAVIHKAPGLCGNCPTLQTPASRKPTRVVLTRQGPREEETVWGELCCYPLLDSKTGEPLGVILRLADITARRRTEARLKESRERLNLATNHLPLALGRLDQEGTVTFWEGRLEELTGYAPEEFAPGGRPWSEAILEEDREPARQAFLRGLGTDRTYVRQYRLKTTDGRIIWLQESGQITCNPQGQPLHTDMVLLDITERKLAEEKCSRVEAQSRQEPRPEALSSLAGSIAHDFNNILGVMLGYTEMALMSLKEDDVSQHRLQQVLRAGQRGKELVNQILGLSRSTQERQSVHLSALIREVLPTLRAALPSSLEINVTLPENRDTVLVDPAQMHQVIISLCANAIQARRDQEGLLDISVAPVNLDADAVTRFPGLSPGPHVRLIVKDTGPGMDQEALAKIFEPLVSPGKTEGPGLGLAVVQDIIKAHHGILTVHSDPGQGTEFHLYLPRAVPGQLPGGIEAAAAENGRYSLLLVDDEEWLVDMWQEILESLGYRTTSTTRPFQALAMVKEDPRFDLVIVDQTMPHLTGLELAEDLKTLRPELPVILVTSFNEPLSQERAEKVGIREYIMKPLSISELTTAIRRVLAKKPME